MYRTLAPSKDETLWKQWKYAARTHYTTMGQNIIRQQFPPALPPLFVSRKRFSSPPTQSAKVVIVVVSQTKYFSVSIVSCFSAAALHTTGGIASAVFPAIVNIVYCSSSIVLPPS